LTGYDDDDAGEKNMEAMPGYYEHEEPVHHILMDGESEDDQVEELDPVTENFPKERVRPSTSAPARSYSIKLKDIDICSEIYHPRPKLLGRERSKSDVGRQPDQHHYDASPERISQMCPICSRLLMTDNQGLNAHVDFCLSRNAIREACDESISSSVNKPDRTSIVKPSGTPAGRGWEFLMSKNQLKKSKKRK